MLEKRSVALTQKEISNRAHAIWSVSAPEDLAYGRLVNWRRDNRWHYGIGLSEEYIFDTGPALAAFEPEIPPTLVTNIIAFSPNETIHRLVTALTVFRDWTHRGSSWNDEHFARLVVTGEAMSYNCKTFLGPGTHYLADEVFNAHVRLRGLAKAPKISTSLPQNVVSIR